MENRYLSYITTMALLLCCLPFKAQTTQQQPRLFYDHLTDTYLCTVNKDEMPQGVDGAKAEDGRTINYTYLPIVLIKGDFGYEHTPGTVTVTMPDGTEQTSLSAKLKWRGGSTNTEGKHKRNYSIKFVDASGKKTDRSFFGLRSDNHWILDAGQVDLSRVRNRTATDLWNDFATKPYYFKKEPKALTGTRGQFVEVFLNDEYRGIYCMTECIDRKQLKLRKYEEDADGNILFHGQLWKGFGQQYCNFYGYGPFDSYSSTWGHFETIYPDLEDTYYTDYIPIYNAVKFISDCEYEDFVAGVDTYFDTPVYLDFYVFCCVLNAIDNSNGKNTYWACYDARQDYKLTPAVWDLDCTVGQSYDPYNPHTANSAASSALDQHNSGSNFTRQYFCFGDDAFTQQARKRYTELRNTVFEPENLKARYHKYMDMLTESGAYARETVRWGGDSDVGGNPLDFAAEREFIDSWIDERIAFLDEQWLIVDGITTHQNVNIDKAPIYDLQGRIVNAERQQLQNGVYIQNGRKFIVK